jgi:C_GCAxxG_C_C family probable redox protein
MNVGNADVFKSASALAGGVARQGDSCGALTGAVMAIGCVMGRERIEDTEAYQKAMLPAIRVYTLFKEKVGHTLCSEIQKIKFGKPYRLCIPEERQAFHNAGGHSRTGCPEVCGIAARIAGEIILDLKKA